jgi:hypothetical protein
MNANNVGLSAALFGTEMTPEAILFRAPLTGLLVGGAQWFVLRQFVQRSPIWIPALALIYVSAWYLTSLVIGESINEGFYVFGASGALVHQALTGLVLWWLLRASGEVRRGLSALHHAADSKYWCLTITNTTSFSFSMGLKRVSTLSSDPSYVPNMGQYRNAQAHSEIILDIAQSRRVMADKRNPKIDPDEPMVYQIRIEGRLGRQWTETGLGA